MLYKEIIVKIDIRSDKSIYVEINGYTVYIDTSLADGIHVDHWYGDDPVKARKAVCPHPAAHRQASVDPVYRLPGWVRVR